MNDSGYEGCSPINIFVMCCNNYGQVRLCVHAIKSRTRYPYRLVLIDNGSDEPELFDYYSALRHDGSGTVVVLNKYNLWVLGLNPALRKYLADEDDRFVVTDSDIIVPPPKDGVCWLGYLVSQMNENPVIGKLGLSLDLGWIKTRIECLSLYHREVKYQHGPHIGTNIIAPVDTTLAIYRYDYFVMRKPRFYPGHGVLSRPYYYCCRTSSDCSCKHLSWRVYSGLASYKYSAKISKCVCFTLMGAYLDPLFLAEIPWRYSAFYNFIRPIARAIWSLNALFLHLSWYFMRIPFKINEIQFMNR